MNEWWEDIARPARTDHALISRALTYLASVCDGANSLDGEGFNALDSDFGKSLAAQSLARGLSPKQESAALKMLRKYRGQLAHAGIDLFGTREAV